MRVGIIGDTHEPYCLDGYLEFCRDTFEEWECERIVHIGDLIDHHALSFHDSEPLLKGAYGELIDAREKLRPWYEAFPELTMCNGNHDLIPARQLKKIGMDADVWMRPLKEIYEMPEGWDIVDTVPLMVYFTTMVIPPTVRTVSEMMQSNVCVKQCQVMPTVMQGYRLLHQNTVSYGEWLLAVE